MNNRGIYLIEVMMITAILTSFILIIPVFKVPDSEVKTENFIKFLNQDIQYGLSYSLSHHSLINIHFIPSKNLYVMYNGKMQQIIKRTYNESLIINSVSIEISHGFLVKEVNIQINCDQKIYRYRIREKGGIIEIT